MSAHKGSAGTIQMLTTDSFVHQHDEELDEVKKTRRKGRPASAREDLLKVKIEELQKEWQNGFREYPQPNPLFRTGPTNLFCSGSRSRYRGEC